MTVRPLCFLVMPFEPELNYFYLYLKHHIETNHSLTVERGDTRCLTKPLIQKITDQISNARLIIADITGANPNVMYEVGLAHAEDKPVVFLTQDPVEDAPVDLQQFEFIPYNLSEHTGFLSHLDRALRNELSNQYDDLFNQACEFLNAFVDSTGLNIQQSSEEEFYGRISRTTHLGGLRQRQDSKDLVEFLLPKIIQDTTDIQIMKKLTEWVSNQSS